NAHRIQIIDTTTILQLQDDTTALFHPDVREEIFYRHGITDYQRSYFSKKVLDTFDIVKLRFQDTFRETVYESAYNIIKAKYSEDFGITQEEWLELVDSKAKDENGVFTQEFEKIVDLCLKEQIFLNLIELSSAQDKDVDTIFSTIDTYLDENFGSLIEQLFNPLTFEAFIDEVINQVLNNMDNEGFVSFNVPTQEYFEDLISVQDSYKDELVSVYWGSPPPPEFKKATFIESNYKTELDELSRLFYGIREYLIDQNNRDLPITDTLLGLHGPKDPGTYTKQHLTDTFNALGLTDNTLLQDMHRTQKLFYKTLLDQIQLDIINNPDTSKFKDYSSSLIGSIDPNGPFTAQELELVKRLDNVLNEVLGYVGYTLLKLGFITFDGNEQIEFHMPQDLTTLAKIIRVLGLDSIAELKTSYFSIMEYLETLIWSMILSGHYMNLKTLDNNGQVELRKAYTYPGNHFLPGIYKNFMGNIPDSIYHLSMIWNFMNLQNMQDRLNLLGINPELEGNAYRLDGRREGEYGTNKLKLLVYDKDLTFEELDIKFRQKFDMNEDLDSNIAIFDRLRQQEGWTTRFGYRSGNVAFVKFRLKFQDGSIKTGYIFAHSGIQVMPGIEIRDGKYYINPDHWANEIYPAFEVNGKPRDSDAERKIILALLDKFDMTNLVEGELALYSERPICPSCALILSNFELGFSYLENNFQFEINENVRNLPLED
ncbi:MAG: hypothetical protein ACFFG0_46285, partial [Candidatus Thorarchaeota archaeon]